MLNEQGTIAAFQVGDRVFLQNQTNSYQLRLDLTGLVIEVKQFHQCAVQSCFPESEVSPEFVKTVAGFLPGTARTIQPLPTTNNNENSSTANQRTRQGELAQTIAKPQNPQTEIKGQAMTDAWYTHRPQRYRRLQIKLHSRKTPLKNSSPRIKTSLHWTVVSCPRSYLLGHPTRRHP